MFTNLERALNALIEVDRCKRNAKATKIPALFPLVQAGAPLRIDPDKT